ncbi:MAG: hypothetical protein ACK47Y_02265 [Dolichospermum sp.]
MLNNLSVRGGNREQGTGNREQGTGNSFNCLDILNFPNPTNKNALMGREQGTGNREQETVNSKQETVLTVWISSILQIRQRKMHLF